MSSAEWWSPGHVLDDASCSNGNSLDSNCMVKCEAPYISYNPLKPYDAWKMQCKGANNPKWKNPSWSKRPDWGCYHCPEQQIIWKPRGLS